MMATKTLIVLCCVLAVVLAEEKYSSKYDNLDLDELIRNKKLFNVYADCLLDKTVKCPPEAKALREHVGDALETGCIKCTEPQEKGVIKMIGYVVKEKPDLWNELCAKYDPTGKWRKHYEERARKEGIEIPKN